MAWLKHPPHSVGRRAQERPDGGCIYQLRYIGGWPMVIPWVGSSLAEWIHRVEPLGSAHVTAAGPDAPAGTSWTIPLTDD